ncbi:hypothetical protein CLM85_00515 [Streptomyces albidoflavus]|nr:hypothetical protein CLM85_00515 [Streptomyces albidoflavus]
MNGDGYGDLVTASEATVAGADGAGAVVVNTGSANGISAARTQVVSQNSAAPPPPPFSVSSRLPGASGVP